MPRLAPVVTLLLFACAPAPDPAVLMEADRAFAEDVARNGSAAWVAWFDEDGAMIQAGAGEVRGRAAIRDAVAYLDRPDVSLRWEPVRADIAASGDLGWTTGTYTVEAEDPDGAINRSRGRYVSIWRRQSDGAWKVVMDLGNPVNGTAGS